MAPINTLSVLAFATAALAVPYHGHNHAKYHNNKPSGFSSQPYGSANGTGIYPTGTGFATGTGAPIIPASETLVVSDVEATTVVDTTSVDATSTCTSEVTVTTTVKKTVTVHPSASSAVQVASSSSSEAAPVESSIQSSVLSSASTDSAAPTSYSSKAEAVTQAAYSSSASSSVEESSSDASPTMTFSAAAKGVSVSVGVGYGSSTASSSAASSTASSSYGKTGKRGVAYNDASLTDCLIGSSKVSWGYNWGSSSSGLSDSVKFIPTLWGPASEFTDSWSSNAKKAIKDGATHLFSFNEPDLEEQSNMTPGEAAAAWKQYMEPFSGDAKLCAPSVTNGGGSMGLAWLSSFLEACTDCTIDCVNIHWYDSAENVEYFKKHINDTVDIAGDKQIFLSEFAATGSDDQISTFLETVMPWMDDNDSVGGYAYFMAGEGKLVSGSEQSAIGKTYAS